MQREGFRIIIIVLIVFTCALDLGSEDLFQVFYVPGEKYKITEISDMRRTVNGKYEGLTYRQVRGILEVVPKGKGETSVEGDFYVFEETKHNTVLVANQVDRIVPVQFTIRPDGTYAVSPASYYPTSRDFPVFPKTPIEKGTKWREYGIRYVEPFNDGVFTRVRFYCEYSYEGDTVYKGRNCKLIKAQYALRYKQGDDPNGDKRLAEITYAGHKVDIIIDMEKKQPVIMRDTIIEDRGGELYKFADGGTLLLKGSTVTYFDIIERLDRDKVIKDLEDLIAKIDIPDVTVEERDEGIALTLDNIRFVADKDIILASEKQRLDALADTLKKIEGRSFLVVGHTAKSGTETEQRELSIRRAKAIVDYLAGKGMDAKRFLYEGRGATEPVAPNDTEANMAKNRRVEIIILED